MDKKTTYLKLSKNQIKIDLEANSDTEFIIEEDE
jgi:hypothetical protein